MDAIFLRVLNMSMAASAVIVIVLIARLLLRRAPRLYSHILWGAVLFRLVSPFSFESVFSLLPIKASPIPANIMYEQVPQLDTGVPVIDSIANPILATQQAAPYASINPMQITLFLAEWLWGVGIFVLLVYSALSLIALRGRLIGAVRLRGNIYLADRIQSPFVMGVIRPKIYLPSALLERERDYIILHEQTHIRRLDHVVKLLAFLALCVHWFNPLVWLAFILFTKDMEMSCDESVMKQMGAEIRGEYAASLLGLATGKKRIAGAPLAFGEGDVKARIKNVLGYKKPALWVSLIALVVAIAAGIGLLANPLRDRGSTITFPAYQGGREEYNGPIYDTEPFTLSLELPDDWAVHIPPEEEQLTAFPFTPVYLYRGDTLMATVGFNRFTLYEGGDVPEGNFYQTVYPELRLGSIFQWQEYTPLKTTETSETALSTVYISQEVEGKSVAEWPVITVPGILCYDTELFVYIAIQFEENAVTEEEQRAIAQSVVLSR